MDDISASSPAAVCSVVDSMNLRGGAQGDESAQIEKIGQLAAAFAKVTKIFYPFYCC